MSSEGGCTSLTRASRGIDLDNTLRCRVWPATMTNTIHANRTDFTCAVTEASHSGRAIVHAANHIGLEQNPVNSRFASTAPLPPERLALQVRKTAGRRLSRDGRTTPVKDRTISAGSSVEHAFIIDFALKWAPYGGPPRDEVFVAFGIDPKEFRTLVLQTLDIVDCAVETRSVLIHIYG